MCVCACAPMHKVYARLDKSNEGYIPDFTNKYRVEREKEGIGEREKRKG